MSNPMTPAQLEREVSREVARIMDSPPPAKDPTLRGGKCRVCADPEARRRVNEMLTHMMRPGEIVENLGDINARKRKNQQIGYNSVRHHRENHFKTQQTVNEGWRRMMERRAAEEGQELAAGTGTILTLRGFLDIIASKGIKHLVQEDAVVTWKDGVEAQEKLESLLKEDKDQAERAAMRRDVALIQQAIVETLTEEQMRAVSHRLDVLRGVVSEDDADETIDGQVVEDDDDDDEVADFVMEEDADDELDQ